MMGGQQGLETRLEPPGTFFYCTNISTCTRTNVAPYEQPTVAGEGKRAQTTPDALFGP